MLLTVDINEIEVLHLLGRYRYNFYWGFISNIRSDSDTHTATIRGSRLTSS